jgi:hypothetical protein
MKRALAPLILLVMFIPVDQDNKQPDKSIKVHVVRVKETALFELPTAVSDVVCILTLGNAVEESGPGKGGWLRVKFEDSGVIKEGYVSKSAVIEQEKYIQTGDEKLSKKITKTNDQQGAKWFNEKVEKEYRKQQGLDREFETTDRLVNEYFPEKHNAKQLGSNIKQFVKEGKLQ